VGDAGDAEHVAGSDASSPQVFSSGECVEDDAECAVFIDEVEDGFFGVAAVDDDWLSFFFADGESLFEDGSLSSSFVLGAGISVVEADLADGDELVVSHLLICGLFLVLV